MQQCGAIAADVYCCPAQMSITVAPSFVASAMVPGALSINPGLDAAIWCCCYQRMRQRKQLLAVAMWCL
ncbi:hypothetical protein U1Q18_013367 [Sarracenia purpurea var. burkii]